MATGPSFLDAPDMTRLDLAAVLIRECLDTPFLVGSVLVYFTEHLVRSTGLRIDFQIQQMTTANARYDGMRLPLGIYAHPSRDGA